MKKYLHAQYLFPGAISVLFVLVMILSAFHFQPIRIWEETPEDRERMSMAQVMWVNLAKQTEKEYFEGTNVVVRAELVSYEGLFCYDAPTNEWELYSRSVFTFRVKEVLYDNAPVAPIEVGKTYRMFKDAYAVGNPYESNAAQFRGYVGEEVLILLDGDPYTLDKQGNPIRNAAAYQQDYVNRMGYRIADPKWGVIPVTRADPLNDAYLPPCLRRAERWSVSDLTAYAAAQVERYDR